MSKLKGCRPSAVCKQAYINTCAELGDAQYRIERLTKRVEELKKDQHDLGLEVDEALKQEAKIKKEEEQNTKESAEGASDVA